jgi:hypothetical protein
MYYNRETGKPDPFISMTQLVPYEGAKLCCIALSECGDMYRLVFESGSMELVSQTYLGEVI